MLPKDGGNCECAEPHGTNLVHTLRFFVMEKTRSQTIFGRPPACEWSACEWSEDRPGRVKVPIA